MRTASEGQSWFGPSLLDVGQETASTSPEFERLWRTFMTARVLLSLALLLLQLTLYGLTPATQVSLLLVCAAYFIVTVLTRLLTRPRALGRSFDPQWLWVIGVDVLTFVVLQTLHSGNFNYTPLFVLPVLLASVLGSLPLALGTAAGITLLLLAHAGWESLRHATGTSSLYIQSSLTGAGTFALAILAHQLSVRLATEEQKARRNQLAARVQQQVNDLVIANLNDGILVIDALCTARAANPAARRLLQSAQRPIEQAPFDLHMEPAWQALVQLTRQSFAARQPIEMELSIRHTNQGSRRLRASTRITSAPGAGADSLCVMFLQDQREMEARLRTEKLASMGRMSAAVAHEIRNPLAAIAQANALLDEEMSEPRHRQLTQMISQNAKRLERIVEEILNISRVQRRDPSAADHARVSLNEAVVRICQDWARQNGCQASLLVQTLPESPLVQFDPDHLRRVLVNLLDNARRYASLLAESIQVGMRSATNGRIVLTVWSDGPAMEQTVERHLFEPFFSSESRSSGLGLYICRELCEGHGASIAYQRAHRRIRNAEVEGNEFYVSLRRSVAALT